MASKASRNSPRDRDRERRGSHRARTYSFLGTVIVIGVLIAASYTASLPRVEHIPQDYKFTPQPWMRYVAADMNYVSYVDYQRSVSVSGNATLFGTKPFIEIRQFDVDLGPDEIVFEVAIQSRDSDGGRTITLLKLQDQTLAKLEAGNVNDNRTVISTHGSHTLLGVLMRKLGEQTSSLGYFTISSGYLLISTNGAIGRYDLERALDQYDLNAPSLFDNPLVKRAIYASGISVQPYIGLFVGMFPTQLDQTTMVVKSIVQYGTGILVTRSMRLPSTDQAVAEYGQAHQAYRDATTYRILDEYLVVSYAYSTNKLAFELRGI